MPAMDRRTFLKFLAVGAASATAATFPFYMNQVQAKEKAPDDFYKVPMKGQSRILHTTDIHGQLLPVYFREPNINLGVGSANGKPPHIVGKEFLKYMDMPEGGVESYLYTYIDFQEAAKKYGKTGGYSHVKTLLDMLRKEAGGKENTVTLDGGDLWASSATSVWTRGVDMVEASNILGVDVMVGHWEFTYPEQEMLSNVALFKGEFIGQNVRVKEEALMDDKYMEMVDKNDGLGLYDEDSAHAFQPYTIKEVGGKRIAIVGQAFPRTSNANPPEFFPDWSFGLREEDMRNLVKKIREEEKPDAVAMLSHNGMDVDIKMGENISGIDVVFGGHTHDAVPKPIKVKNKDGDGHCLVTNGGSNGKVVGVMDFDFTDGKVNMDYKCVPVVSDWLPADPEMEAYITQMRDKKYDDKIVESRNPKRLFNKDRVGKTYKEILEEKLAIADRLLYRRGNLMGTWDQILCNALRAEYDADVSFSPGVRWGTTVLEGDWITMEDLMTHCAMTYAETYVNEMTGEDLLKVIEEVANNLFDPDPYLQSGGDMVRIGGMDYTIAPEKELYKRITDAKLDNGDPIDPKKTYQVAGWATVNRTPEGRLMWDVARDYILKNKGKDDVLKIEKINHPVLEGVKDNVGVADYEGKRI